MNPKRRKFATLVFASSLVCVAGTDAQTKWPTQPIRIILPTAAGGVTDVLARTISEKLGAALGQPVIAENKPGQGGALGGAFVAAAKPDGYTLLLMSPAHLVAPVLYRDLTFDPTAFAPIVRLASTSFILVVNPSLPVKSVSELVALSKSRPLGLNFGSSGNGSNQHLVTQMFIHATGANLHHIPYKGSGPVTTDLIGGQIDLSFMASSNAIPHVKSGRLRALAISSAKRSPEVPDIPTVGEAGVKGFEAVSWIALVGPKGTPPTVVARLDAELQKIMADASTRKHLLEGRLDVDVAGNQQLSLYLGQESVKWFNLAKSLNIKQE